MFQLQKDVRGHLIHSGETQAPRFMWLHGIRQFHTDADVISLGSSPFKVQTRWLVLYLIASFSMSKAIRAYCIDYRHRVYVINTTF